MCKLDPRTKFLTITALLIATLLSTSILSLGGSLTVWIGVFMFSKTPLRLLWRNILLVSWLLLFTFSLTLWGSFTETGEWMQSLQISGLAVARLSLLVGWGTILSASLSPLEIVAGFERLLRPFRQWGVPAQKFSIVVMLTLRLIPILREEQRLLLQAHILRGIDFSTENLWKRLKQYVLLCGPLFLSMLRRVEHLSLAMDARAFRVQGERTALHKLRMTGVDYMLLSGVALVLVALGTISLF